MLVPSASMRALFLVAFLLTAAALLYALRNWHWIAAAVIVLLMLIWCSIVCVSCCCSSEEGDAENGRRKLRDGEQSTSSGLAWASRKSFDIWSTEEASREQTMLDLQAAREANFEAQRRAAARRATKRRADQRKWAAEDAAYTAEPSGRPQHCPIKAGIPHYPLEPADSPRPSLRMPGHVLVEGKLSEVYTDEASPSKQVPPARLPAPASSSGSGALVRSPSPTRRGSPTKGGGSPSSPSTRRSSPPGSPMMSANFYPLATSKIIGESW